MTSANEPNVAISDLGERLDVAPRQRAKQNELEQLVVGQRLRPGLAKPFAQPFAMAVIVRRFGKAPPLVAVLLVLDHEDLGKRKRTWVIWTDTRHVPRPPMRPRPIG